MMELSRRALLAGAGAAVLTPGGTARALDAAEIAALLGVADVENFVKRTPQFLAVSPWGSAPDRLWAACLAQEGNQVTAAIIHEDDGGANRRVVAGPVDVDVLSIDPFWTINLSISPLMPLGSGIPAFGVTVSNSYLSTGRSTWSESMSVFLRNGDGLRQVFRGYVGAGSTEVVDCRRPRADEDPCRRGWSRRWIIKAAGPSVAGNPPTLVVVEKASKRIVSRHVWRGDRYQPDAFERLPGG